MATSRPPEAGTLVIAALLLMVLGFSGYWITLYANPDNPGRPWEIIQWFLGGAVVILVAALVLYLRGGRSSGV